MLRLLALTVFQEEGWPSVSLCTEMLERHWNTCADAMPATFWRPRFRSRFRRIPGCRRAQLAVNCDRLINRMYDYPREIRRMRSEYDLFHLCDHSYAHLLHCLPPHSCGVMLQDLDTYRCLLDPGYERRPFWFRRMTRLILTGLQRAAIVFYSTQYVREQVERTGLISPERLVHAPLGIAEEFIEVARSQPTFTTPAREPYLLHVGSCIQRKRIDVLLEVFARCRAIHPTLRLVKIGGEFSSDQVRQSERVNVKDH